MSNPKWPTATLDAALDAALANGDSVLSSPGAASALRYALHRRKTRRGLTGRVTISMEGTDKVRVVRHTEAEVEIIVNEAPLALNETEQSDG